jgi:endonuclease YncB( thermonuclease family)
VTTDRYRRTVAVVRVGDTVVNEELIRQGPGASVRPVLRPGNLPGVAGAGRRGASSEAGTLVYAERYPPVGVPPNQEMTGSYGALPPPTSP